MKKFDATSEMNILIKLDAHYSKYRMIESVLDEALAQLQDQGIIGKKVGRTTIETITPETLALVRQIETTIKCMIDEDKS
jgi:hypothetical protein